MSQSTIVSLMMLAVVAFMAGYLIGQDDRERSKSSQQVEQTIQKRQGVRSKSDRAFFV
jgi:hypothetical protein